VYHPTLDPQKDAQQQFIKDLHRALTVDEVREIYFDTVSEILPADGIGFYRFEFPDADRLVERQATLGDSFLHSYERSGRADDPVLDFVTAHLLPHDSSSLAEDEWQSSGAYRVLSNEGLSHSLEAPLTEATGIIGTINFARATDAPAFTADEVDIAKFVSEHLSLAIERAKRHELLGERANLLQGAIEHFPQGLIIHDMDGTPLFANKNAIRVMDETTQNTHERPSINDLLTEVITDFVAGNRRVATVNAREAHTGKQTIIKSFKAYQHESIVSLIYEGPDKEAATLPTWDVLSPREQEIATFVSRGLTTREIATEAFVSENTVKQHLKRIFAKTDVHSRAELVQLIWSSNRHHTSTL